VELLAVEEEESLLRREDRRLGPVGREASDEGVDRLALVGHKGRDVDERRNLGMRTRLSDDGATIGVTDEDDRLARRVNCPLGDCNVVGERERRILDDADAVAIPLQLVVPNRCGSVARARLERVRFLLCPSGSP
jgi:hypothetical protein